MSFDLNPMNPMNAAMLPAKSKRDLFTQSQEITKNVLLAAYQNNGDAAITNVAMENLATLSAVANHLKQVSPEGSPYYDALLAAYTMKAAKEITEL